MPAPSEKGTHLDREPQSNRLPFREKLEARQKAVNSLLCVGLDPDPEKIPAEFQQSVRGLPFSEEFPERGTVQNEYDRLMVSGREKKARNMLGARIAGEFCMRIIDKTHTYVAEFKPNIAFFESYLGDGIDALEQVFQYIEKTDPTIVAILDAKRADIGNTNKGYARMFANMEADAMTVNPYFGIEALGPLLDLEGKGIIVLCKTSNKEAAEIQDVMVDDPELGRVRNYIRVAHMAEKARQKNPNIAIVVGATYPEEMEEIRQVFKGIILVPGLGSQGGQPEDLIGGLDEDGFGIIPSNSSAILYASKGENFAEASGQAAEKWRDAINVVRRPDIQEVLRGMTPTQIEVANMMLTAKVDGKLTRRDGEPGNFTYTERKGKFPMVTISSDPEHEFVGAANYRDATKQLLAYFANLRGGSPENYVLMAKLLAAVNYPFAFDYVTGIPTTGKYIAKPLAEALGLPYYEILEKTAEGAERKFEVKHNVFDEEPQPGMKGLLVDDLITTSVTKFEAEKELTDDGFEIAGHAVVLDREEGGVGEMHSAGKEIVTGITATQLFTLALVRGIVSEDVYGRLMENIKSSNGN